MRNDFINGHYRSGRCLDKIVYLVSRESHSLFVSSGSQAQNRTCCCELTQRRIGQAAIEGAAARLANPATAFPCNTYSRTSKKYSKPLLLIVAGYTQR
jgi:hypothetical protein